MKFVHREIHSFEDSQRNFEQLEGKDVLDQTGESVLQLATTGTVRKAIWGTGSIVFTSSQTATSMNVTHGLGATPQTVFCQATAVGGVAVDVYASTLGATTFKVDAFCTVSLNQSLSFYWLAIG
jgi:hypothetical protein